MTLRIALASLVAMTAVAAAEPAPKKADGPGELIKKCEATGTPLFEKDHTTKTGKGDAEIWRIYESGALAKQVGKGKPAEPTCLSGPQLEDFKKAIAASHWKINTARVHCMMATDEVTIYTVRGKEVFRDYVCSGRTLDDVSQKAIDMANGLIQRM
ncbi:MAG TPA: hypothetical protein VGM88_16155 [Kofleriaceae bacterium]|jgi:hypothetical protein